MRKARKGKPVVSAPSFFYIRMLKKPRWKLERERMSMQDGGEGRIQRSDATRGHFSGFSHVASSRLARGRARKSVKFHSSFIFHLGSADAFGRDLLAASLAALLVYKVQRQNRATLGQARSIADQNLQQNAYRTSFPDQFS